MIYDILEARKENKITKMVGVVLKHGWIPCGGISVTYLPVAALDRECWGTDKDHEDGGGILYSQAVTNLDDSAKTYNEIEDEGFEHHGIEFLIKEK